MTTDVAQPDVRRAKKKSDDEFTRKPEEWQRRSRGWVPTSLTHFALIVISIIMVSPFFYVIAASLKDSGSLFAYPPKWVELPPYWGNYSQLLFHSNFLRWMLNTAFVTLAVTGLKVVLDSMAGFALAKLSFTGRKVVFILLIALLMVPFAVLLIPLWTVCQSLGILNTYWALILPPLANPLGPFLMRQIILGLPTDLENAARLEGLSEFGIYRRIIMPLIKPGLVVLAIVIFTGQWVSFLWPLVAVQSDHLQLLTVGVASMRAKGAVNYGLWSAAGVMSLVPLAIFFFVLQKQFLGRSMAGALK
ncbi:MAG: carbohydrate ABC transporter permease [Actinomycetia bacterium]|nr:carbohydrate ABC transporter permease [Actinomycetes bacterium]